MEESYEQGLQLFQAGKIDQAMSVLDAYVRRHPKHVQANFILGVCHFRYKHFDHAEVLFRTVISLDNGHYNAYYYLGLTLERQNRPDEARQFYQYALNLKPDFVEAQRKLGPTGQVVPPRSQTVYPTWQVASSTEPIPALKKLPKERYKPMGCLEFVFLLIKLASWLALGVFIGVILGVIGCFLISFLVRSTRPNSSEIASFGGIGGILGFIATVIFLFIRNVGRPR
jgi:tetratricopeptide (TPR) repeat protein